jgi:hypothetical protein
MIFTIIFLLQMGVGLAQQLPEKRRWALVMVPPTGDPVHLSSWNLRESCERERLMLVQVALNKGVPLPGTRCEDDEDQLVQPDSLLVSWLLSLFRKKKDRIWANCPRDLEGYLEDAVSARRMTQEAIAQDLQACSLSSSPYYSLASESLPDGKVILRSEYRIWKIGRGEKQDDPPIEMASCWEYLLTFDQHKILRELKKNSWRGRCNKDLQDQEKSGVDAH